MILKYKLYLIVLNDTLRCVIHPKVLHFIRCFFVSKLQTMYGSRNMLIMGIKRGCSTR